MKKRLGKRIFQKEEVEHLRSRAISRIKSEFLPDEKIIRIILIGSSVKNTFGEYDPPGFRGSLFSDFDFIVFVEDDFKIPGWLEKEPDGKPFADGVCHNLAYRNRKFILSKYDVEIFFIRRSDMQKPIVQKAGELAGIPMTVDSKHKHLIVHGNSSQ